jgi:hypothetical protein
LIVFGFSVPFIRLLILEIQKGKVASGTIWFLCSIIAMFLSLDVWIWAIYNTPQEIQLRLFEDRLEITSAVAPIPITNVEAHIGPIMIVGALNGVAVSVNGGEGLILNINDYHRFLDPGFMAQMTTVYGETNRLRFLIDRMITKSQADSFIDHLRTSKSSTKASP